MPKRSKARALAMQIIFQLQIQSDRFLDQIDDFVKNAGLDAGLSRYGRELGLLAWEKRSEADELIGKFAKDWTASSLPACVEKAEDRLCLHDAKNELLQLGRPQCSWRLSNWFPRPVSRIRQTLQNYPGWLFPSFCRVGSYDI